MTTRADEFDSPGATSDSNDSHDGAAIDSSKKRKPTYYVRKEEKALLEQEVQELQERIRILESTQHVSAKRELEQSIALNSFLNKDVGANNLALAGSQSLISAGMLSRFRNPLDYYIYLPSDQLLRQQCLLGMKTMKIDTATKLMRERSRFLDLRRQHRHSERNELKNGDLVFSFFDITPFEGVTDARLVFGHFAEFVTHQEISISDSLGFISIRETDDSPDTAVSQFRLLSTLSPGLDVECNLVSFTQFISSSAPGSPAYGVGTVDYVDKDELHAYQPETRLRKDLSACAYIIEVPAADGEDACVSMARFSTIRLHRPSFASASQMELAARDCVDNWCDVMPHAIKERLGMLDQY